MLFKEIHKRLKTGLTTEQDDGLLKLFANFKESVPTVEERVFNVLNWAKSQGYLEDLGISEDNAETFLRNYLIEWDLPKEFIQNKNLLNELTRVAAKRGGKGSPVGFEEAKEGIELISTGELFKDIGYSITVIFALVAKPERFLNLDDNLKTFVEGLVNLPGAIASDVNPRIAAEKVSRLIGQIQSGQSLENPDVLDNTLAEIYAFPEAGDVIDTVNALLDQENESLRLALLIYARLNGINLEQRDIDKVRATVLNRENPDLGSLLLYIGNDKIISRLTL